MAKMASMSNGTEPTMIGKSFENSYDVDLEDIRLSEYPMLKGWQADPLLCGCEV